MTSTTADALPPNPRPCCWARVNRDGTCAEVRPDHLGPIEDPHDAQGQLPDGRAAAAKAGFRRCQICGARHYFLQVDPIPLGLTGAPLG